MADFVGETNWLEAEVEKVSPGQVWLQTVAGPFRTATDAPWQTGQKVSLGFRPESVQIGRGDVNSFHMTIAQVCYLGETEQYVLELPGGPRIKAVEQNPVEIRRPGEGLEVHVRPQDLLLHPEK